MVISTPIGRRLSSALIGMIVLATAPAQALFLDALTCELDPLYDRCLALGLQDFAENLPRGAAKDRAFVASFAGLHFAARTESERDFPPDPAVWTDGVSELMASVVRVLDLALRRENFEAAAAEVDAISPGTAQLLALRYLGEAHILFGAPADAVPILQRYLADISNISSPPSRLGHLGNVAWLLAEAGDEESAAQAVAALLEIANSQPIAQLRPIFSMDAAAAESLLVGTSAGAARIEAALDALYALSNLPPGFTVETQAIAVKNYGRLGLTSEGRALAQQVLTAIDEVDSDRQGEVLRNLMEARFPF